MNFKKTLFLLIFVAILCPAICLANMASPYIEKTKSASALSSKDVAILSELIRIKINKDFSEATFTVVYTIQNDVGGTKIPLLFLALDYKKDFKVWLDGVPVAIKAVPDEYIELENSRFKNFSPNFKGEEGEVKQVAISFQKDYTASYDIRELKFFEANVTKGIHQIKVEYIAEAWEDRSDWVKALTFRYSLSPAKHWKSFENLTVQLVQEGSKELTSNLGKATITNETTEWRFSKIPADYIEISHKAKQSAFVNTIIDIEPGGFMNCAGMLFLLLHLFILYRYRKASIQKSNKWVWIGSALVPFLTILVYNLSFGFIDNMIGVDASRHHGYYILFFGLYPFIALAYWLFAYLVNRFIIRKMP